MTLEGAEAGDEKSHGSAHAETEGDVKLAAKLLGYSLAGFVLLIVFVILFGTSERPPAAARRELSAHDRAIIDKIVADAKREGTDAKPLPEGKESKYSALLSEYGIGGNARPNLELVPGWTFLMTSAYGGHITGTVRNNSGRAYRYAQITFTLYDASGAQVGTALANIANLEVGGRWKFRAGVLQPDARSCRLDKLSGF
jgi:hypothetical protein